MNAIDAVHALEGIAAALALGAMAYGPWQWVSVDLARHRMFASRDKLFDMAVAGKLEFGSPEYEGVRDSFNHMIRFAHSLTWLRFLFILTIGKPLQRKEGATPRVLVAGIRDQEIKRVVRRLQREVEQAAMLLMIMRAPGLVLASIVLIIPALLVVGAFIWARDVLRGWADDIGDLLEIEARIFDL